jgi:hypothetical protein
MTTPLESLDRPTDLLLGRETIDGCDVERMLSRSLPPGTYVADCSRVLGDTSG